MSTQKRNGFTIIEVMLFLAVSGALTVGILIGSSAVIGQQRYRDSVNSFKGLIQEQYGEVANVINSEAQNPICSRSGDAVVFDDAPSRTRGTSDCLLLGKFILVEPTQVMTYTVVGDPDATSSADNDTDALRGHGLGTWSPEEHAISWGARIVQPETGDGLTTSILIVRSPLSGSILTYVLDGDHRLNIRDMISDERMAQKDFCVDSGGMSGMSNSLAVRLNARASNQSAVEIPLETDGICG